MTGLRALRQSRRMTQRELGERIGVTRVHIGRFEAGTRTPPPATAHRLACALSVDPAGLGEALEAAKASARPSGARTRPEATPCGSCGRRLDPMSRRAGERPILSEDWCRWCARPMTAAAVARAPIEGFIALANGAARRAAVGRGDALGDAE